MGTPPIRPILKMKLVFLHPCNMNEARQRRLEESGHPTIEARHFSKTFQSETKIKVPRDVDVVYEIIPVGTDIINLTFVSLGSTEIPNLKEYENIVDTVNFNGNISCLAVPFGVIRKLNSTRRVEFILGQEEQLHFNIPSHVETMDDDNVQVISSVKKLKIAITTDYTRRRNDTCDFKAFVHAQFNGIINYCTKIFTQIIEFEVDLPDDGFLYDLVKQSIPKFKNLILDHTTEIKNSRVLITKTRKGREGVTEKLIAPAQNCLDKFATAVNKTPTNFSPASPINEMEDDISISKKRKSAEGNELSQKRSCLNIKGRPITDGPIPIPTEPKFIQHSKLKLKPISMEKKLDEETKKVNNIPISKPTKTLIPQSPQAGRLSDQLEAISPAKSYEDGECDSDSDIDHDSFDRGSFVSSKADNNCRRRTSRVNLKESRRKKSKHGKVEKNSKHSEKTSNSNLSRSKSESLRYEDSSKGYQPDSHMNSRSRPSRKDNHFPHATSSVSSAPSPLKGILKNKSSDSDTIPVGIGKPHSTNQSDSIQGRNHVSKSFDNTVPKRDTAYFTERDDATQKNSKQWERRRYSVDKSIRSKSPMFSDIRIENRSECPLKVEINSSSSPIDDKLSLTPPFDVSAFNRTYNDFKNKPLFENVESTVPGPVTIENCSNVNPKRMRAEHNEKRKSASNDVMGLAKQHWEGNSEDSGIDTDLKGSKYKNTDAVHQSNSRTTVSKKLQPNIKVAKSNDKLYSRNSSPTLYSTILPSFKNPRKLISDEYVSEIESSEATEEEETNFNSASDEDTKVRYSRTDFHSSYERRSSAVSPRTVSTAGSYVGSDISTDYDLHPDSSQISLDDVFNKLAPEHQQNLMKIARNPNR